MTDTGAIEAVVDAVIAENPDNVAAYKGGKVGLMGWFVGQVMKNRAAKLIREWLMSCLKPNCQCKAV